MIEGVELTIIVEHLTYFLLGEAHHGIELAMHGVVGADIKSAGEVIHRHGAHTGDEGSTNGTTATALHYVKKLAEGSRTMSLRLVGLFDGRIGQNVIGEVVVLVDEEVDLLTNFFGLAACIIEHVTSRALLRKTLQRPFWQKVGILLNEVFDVPPAIVVHALLVAFKLARDHRKVKIEHQILVMFLGGMLPYP